MEGEGGLAGCHFMQQAAEGPNVKLLVMHLDALWRGVGQCPLTSFHSLARLKPNCQSEIAEFDLVAGRQQDIFRLDVVVDDFVLVQVVDASDDLQAKLPDLLMGQSGTHSGSEVGLAVLKNEVTAGLVLEAVFHLHNVPVLEGVVDLLLMLVG